MKRLIAIAAALLIPAATATTHVGHKPTADGKRYTKLYRVAEHKKPAATRGLVRPGRYRIAHLSRAKQTRLRRVMQFRLWPQRYRNMRYRNMSNKDRFMAVLARLGWTPAERRAADWLLRRESCGGYSPWAYFGSCGGTPGRNLNGARLACGIPMFLPCRHHGDLRAQAEAFHFYIRGRYGSIRRANGFKSSTGWY
jgi:hypothetical protein